ncbi:cytochrome c [Polymorphobacter sp. PAMC 29334]|uniref:c-type cytochrome n=1 Tax=Polymorphobacter sp. PAMC 29334 TaxID=2862331 RepID=UPI001C783B3B|nr:cytochrome c [Polymorphobacter sp. PAMC 29334]QYE34906.1 cytochrome c [Polymorphobacter sp. PAMC 29334]
MIRFAAAALALMMLAPAALALDATPAAPPAAPVAGDAAKLFPPGPGHDTTLRICSTCHSPGVAAQQRLSPDGWKSIVEQMAGFGAPGTDAELAEITAYLAKSFPEPAK